MSGTQGFAGAAQIEIRRLGDLTHSEWLCAPLQHELQKTLLARRDQKKIMAVHIVKSKCIKAFKTGKGKCQMCHSADWLWVAVKECPKSVHTAVPVRIVHPYPQHASVRRIGLSILQTSLC